MPPMRTTVVASSSRALEHSLYGLFPDPQTVARAWSGLAVQEPCQPGADRARVQEQLPLPLTLWNVSKLAVPGHQPLQGPRSCLF